MRRSGIECLGVPLLALMVLLAASLACKPTQFRLRSSTPETTPRPRITQSAAEAGSQAATATVAPPTETPTVAPSPTPAEQTGTVIATVLNVRAGAGTNQAIVARAKEGEQVTVIGKNDAGTWLRVRTAGGQEGWVSAEFVRVGAP
jgi:uncharacterized protein YgiM (DUF1202 family)